VAGGEQPLILRGQGFEFSLDRIAVLANLEQQLCGGIRWIHGAALLGLRRASFFTALEHCKLFVEPGNQLSDSGFGETVFPEWMLALQTLESSLQVS
jgi:hypothetical protein